MIKQIFYLFSRFILQTQKTIGQLFRQTIAFLAFLFVPFQSDVNLRVYLNILSHLESPSHVGTLWRRRIQLFRLLLRLKSLHFLYLLFFPSTSDLDILVHFDIFEYMLPGVAINSTCFLYCTLPVFVSGQMFFHVQKPLLDRLISVLHHHSTAWFLGPTYKGKNPICPLLVRLYATIFNLQSTFQFATEIVLVLFEGAFLVKAWPHLTPLSFFANILSFLSFLLHAVTFFFIIPLAFSILFTALAMFHIKMAQIYSKLSLLLRQRPLSYSKLENFQRTFLSTFLFFLRINVMYRWIFAFFLLSSVPLNVLFTICFLLKRISPERIPFTLFILYYTFLFIFIFHLAFAYPSRAIHRFGALFQHSLACKHPTSGRTRSRMRLSHLIAAFHVPARDRYGFNYGNWGLVSLENFLKYLIIYSKLAMALYKLLN